MNAKRFSPRAIAVGSLAALAWLSGSAAWAAAPASDQLVREAARVVPAGPAQPLDLIAIRVGNEIITTVDIEEPLRQLRLRLQQEFRGAELEDKMKTAREQHVERLIEAKLLLLEARDQGLEIQNTLVEERADQEIETLRNQFPSSQAFEKQLALEHLTLESLRRQRQALARENLLRQKLLQMKLQEFRTGVDFSDEQLRAYYDEHPEEFRTPERAHIRQLFVAHPDTSLPAATFQRLDDEARAKIEKARALLREGRSFEAVAREFSEHRASAEQGGDIGWIEEGDTGLPELDQAIFQRLKPGETSGIVNTARGYFVVQLVERQAGGPQPFAEVRGRISQKLMAEGSEERFGAWIDRLKNKFEIVRLHPAS